MFSLSVLYGSSRARQEVVGKVWQGGWLWEGWHVAEGLQRQVEVSSHDGGLPPPSLPVDASYPGAVGSSHPLRALPSPAVPLGSSWESRQSNAGCGGQCPEGVPPLAMSVQWPNDWKRWRPCCPPSALPMFLMCWEEEWVFSAGLCLGYK